MNLKPEELVKALRCTSAPGGPTGGCETCPYYRKEILNDELKEKLGTDVWTSCDTDKVGMDAAEQIERDQKEIAELRAVLERATELADAANEKCDRITKKLEQYRALIPSWVIPKEETP